MTLNSLFVDFNSYFASVEQQEQPDLRGKPVAVVPVEAETTCCIAASYEAKKFGVRTGTRVSDARKMCPGLRVIHARPEVYIDFHERIVKTVDQCVLVESVSSIDEMCCSLTGKWRQREAAVELAKKIKEAIRKNIGSQMTSSIGIAPNPFLAKVASDMQKPDGLIVIEPTDLPGCLHSLKLRDIWGIGRGIEERLRLHSIRTVKALCQADVQTLRAIWGGIEGERKWHELRGEAVYRPPSKKRTLSHSHVLAPELRNEEAAKGVLHRLLQKAAMRLRYTNYFTEGLQLSIEYQNGPSWSDELRFTGTQDTLELTRHFLQLWERKRAVDFPPLHVGVTFFSLVPAHLHTPSLFDDPQRQPLLKALDDLNLKLGKNTVFFGGAINSLNHAPMRIAFNRIPDPKIEGD